MKQLYSFISAAALCMFTHQGSAQCGLSLSASASTVCKGDSVTITANATVPGANDSLTTTFAAGNAHRGNMFDVYATNAVTITSFDAHPQSSTTIEIWYRPSPYSGYGASSAGWTLIGSAAVTAQPTGSPTPVPVPVNVSIPAGQTYAFYVTSTNTAVSLNYTDGTTEGATYASDANIVFKEGIGLEYPFNNGSTSFFSPRIWNGIIHYTVAGPPVTVSYLWNTADTTQSVGGVIADTTQYSVQVTMTGCPTLYDTIDIIASVPQVAAGADQTICAGTSVTLSGSGAASYSWNNGVTDNVAFTPASSMNYIVTGTDSIGCTGTDTVMVTVNTVDTATSVMNETITASATGATYQWIDCGTSSAIGGANSQSYTATSNGSYAVIVTQNGCTDTSSCQTISSVGIAGVAPAPVSIYPNPSRGQITVYTGNTVASDICIFDVTGKTISRFKPAAAPLAVDLSQYTNGIYFMRITLNGQVTTTKLIKE